MATKRVEAFVSAPEQYETIPDHPRAHFAQGRYLVEQNENDAALEQYTLVLGSQQTQWLPAAYFNRGNINLREAMAMDGNDPQMIPLVELAKQDYRSALKQQPEFWDARFNLEVALRLVPEDPEVDGNFKSRRSTASAVLKPRHSRLICHESELPQTYIFNSSGHADQFVNDYGGVMVTSG